MFVGEGQEYRAGYFGLLRSSHDLSPLDYGCVATFDNEV